MALNFQTSTLSLTLPISCQICLGKVKQPVICANNHVFCSSCMEMWLKKASQCPTCRVPITAENPCREIIGGTNESDHSDSPRMRKCLRKTRGELLLREYEEEIEGLIRENDELKTKSQSLESQLKTALDPCTINTVQTDDKKVDPYVLEEWTNKLRAATDVCHKVKQDMDKLKEANKTLRSQNVDLVQENMRLKAEVVSRSPQKFGRYTVAALEAKIQQYEREVDHLKRALERSDQYIEGLESRLRKSEKKPLNVQEACGSGNAGPEPLTQQQKINMMLRSLSDSERQLISSNPEAECSTSASSDMFPTTPSSAFRSLTLKSPGIREKKVVFKPASYLRRLDFEEFPSTSSTTENQFSSLDKFPKVLPQGADIQSSNCVFWSGWQGSKPNENSCPGTSKNSSVTGATSCNLGDDEPDSFQTNSEASMDAAYLDKISELDSMMLDGESSSSRGSQFSLASSPPADLDNTLVPDPQTCHDRKPVTQCDPEKQATTDNMDGTPNNKEAPKSFPEVSSSGCAGPSQTDELSFDLLFDSLEESKTAGPSGSVNPSNLDHDQVNPTSSSSGSKPVNTSRDRHTLMFSQPTKRKSHSPFNTSSPTKLSKLM
ncbi:ORC ubiquitin ligase 1 [Halichoeres trimaculatus]|uniref:ORC ubiquitin ligase 1 n=1 Tax=Halichoeres trimaculatus TaxID=147232 RepID=UPI003D9E687B